MKKNAFLSVMLGSAFLGFAAMNTQANPVTFVVKLPAKMLWSTAKIAASPITLPLKIASDVLKVTASSLLLAMLYAKFGNNNVSEKWKARLAPLNKLGVALNNQGYKQIQNLKAWAQKKSPQLKSEDEEERGGLDTFSLDEAKKELKKFQESFKSVAKDLGSGASLKRIIEKKLN